MPSAQSVLVLSPHPDDESLGCGGTICLLSQSGVQVDVLYMTRGELGADGASALSLEARQHLAETREREARAACRILGVRQVDFLDGSDGRLMEQPHLAQAIRQRLAAAPYTRVFCPWFQEKHPDHMATYQLLREALRGASSILQIWLYEVWTPLPANLYVPIDVTFDTKVAAIQAHQSQLACLDYLAAFRGLAAYRSLASPGSRYVEAFIDWDAPTVMNHVLR